MNTVKENFLSEVRKNFLSVDKQHAISSYGQLFVVGEVVGHDEGEKAGQAKIMSFEFDEKSNEVKANTEKGYAHLDFLVKL